MPEQNKTIERRPDNSRRKPFVRKPASRFGFSRKKACFFCVKKMKAIDYKDINLLRKHVTERGKILPMMATSTCAKHQRLVSKAIKRARFMGLLSYIEK